MNKKENTICFKGVNGYYLQNKGFKDAYKEPSIINKPLTNNSYNNAKLYHIDYIKNQRLNTRFNGFYHYAYEANIFFTTVPEVKTLLKI